MGVDVEARNRLMAQGVTSLDSPDLLTHLTPFQVKILSGVTSKTTDYVQRERRYIVKRGDVYAAVVGMSSRRVTYMTRAEAIDLIRNKGSFISWYPLDLEHTFSLQRFLIERQLVINGLLDYTLTALQLRLKLDLAYPQLLDYPLPLPRSIEDKVLVDSLLLTRAIHVIVLQQVVDNSEVFPFPTDLTPEEHNQLQTIYQSLKNDTFISIHDILRSPLSLDTKKEIFLRLLNEEEDNDIKTLLSLPEDIHRLRRQRSITLDRILSLNVSEDTKLDLIERYIQLQAIPTNEKRYTKLRDQLNEDIRKAQNKELSLRERIKLSKLPTHVKDKLLHEYTNTNADSSEYAKRVRWVETWLKLPTESAPLPTNDPKELYDRLRRSLDAKVYGMTTAKDAVVDYVFRFITNPTNGLYLGLHGPKGVGKTFFASAIAEALGRPIVRVNLGGAQDSSKIVGHSYTYVGSMPGQIVDGLIKAKVTNPVFLLDEVDKISSHRDEITGTLLHILDPIQNHEFLDEYLGIPIDISSIVWLVSFNYRDRVDPVLLDRLNVIEIKPYNTNERIHIARDFLLPDILKSLKLPWNPIRDDVIRLLTYKRPDEGMRYLKHALETLCARVNVWWLTGKVKEGYVLTDSDVHSILPPDSSTPVLTYYT
jgi:ATP-dependent Lon protease